MKKRTKLEKQLISIIAVLVLLIISGFRLYDGYLVMGANETINVVCLFFPKPQLIGPFEVAYQGNIYEYWELSCPAITTQ